MQFFVEQPMTAIPPNNKTFGGRRFDIKSTQQLSKNRRLLRDSKSNDGDDDAKISGDSE